MKMAMPSRKFLILTAVALLSGCSSVSQTSSTPPSAGGSTEADALPEKLPEFNADTRFAAGQVAETQHNPAGAAVQYEETLKLKPDHLGAMYRLGIIYTELKQYTQAISAWERYVQATNGSAIAYADLGFCEELAGQTGNAEAAFLAGIQSDPNNVACHVNYGLMLAHNGRIDDAIHQWGLVLSDAEVHYNLGGVYAAEGRKEQARAEFNKALKLDPQFADAKSRLTMLDQQ
jgi:tetratricopeptide (TPR) repeat protein